MENNKGRPSASDNTRDASKGVMTTSTLVLALKKYQQTVFRFTFGERLTLTFVLVAFLPLFVFGLVSIKNLASSRIDGERNLLTQVAQTAAARMEDIFKAAEIFAEKVESGAISTVDPVNFSRSCPLLAGVTLNGGNGIDTWFADPSLQGIRKPESDFFREGSSGRWLYCREVKKGSDRWYLYFDLSRHLRSLSQGLAPSCFLRIALDSTYILAEDRALIGAKVGFVNDYSLFLDKSPFLPRQAYAREEPVFVIIGKHLRTGDGKTTLRVMAGENAKTILSEVFSYRTTLSSYLLVGFALVLVMSLLFARFITSPLRDLSKAVLQQNSTNIKELKDISYGFNDEISDLYEAVKKLSNDLRTTFLRLEENQVVLERTIEERTALLQAALKELEETKNNLELTVSRQASQLVAAERRATIATYVNGLAHNLKNPLANIMGYISLLDDEIRASGVAKPEWDEYIAIMSEGCAKMREIIDNMLDRASSRESEKRVWIDVNRLISREVLFLESDLFFKHQVTKELNFDESLPSFYGSYSGLSQVMENILRNAREAMQDSPVKRLRISTRSQDGMLIIEVEDSGSGMTPEVQQRIFEPHYSTKRGKSMIGGSGVGLSFCKLTVESYGGSISVQSEPGKGAIFTIALPYTAANGNEDKES
ncbi:MAG: hypothetical protein Kow00107_02220 [Planctomycetota bacterium]